MTEPKKIHIAMVGETIDNVVAGIIMTGAVGLYPIRSQKFQDASLKQLKDKLVGIRIFEEIHGKPLVVNPFEDDSFVEIVNLIIDIVQYHRDKDAEFWVNITGGTNLMSAAAEAGAVLTRSKAYYVVEGVGTEKGGIITLPWHSIFPRSLDANRLSILQAIEKRSLSNDGIVEELKGRISKKQMSIYLKELDRAGYVQRMRSGKHTENILTPWGHIALRLNDIG